MSTNRDRLRSEACKAAYKDTRRDNYNPAQFEDQRQKKWYAEKYSFIVRMRGFWNVRA